jgi:tetratricopeptide (TPR) repeat protein
VDIVGVNEADLVEATAMHRQAYRQHLIALHGYYLNHGNTEKARQAERELRDLRKVKQYRFLTEAEVPQRSLRPSQSIAAADALYEDGLHYLKSGGHGIPLYYDENKMKIALEKFQTIIRDYPMSDKIDDAAFYCGEIHKEYFNDNNTAVQFYLKAIEWDPNTPHSARFQAAVVLDYRLHDRDAALELYQRVLKEETFEKTNVSFSRRRIGQLLDPTRRGSVAPTLPEPLVGTSAAPSRASTAQTTPPAEEGRP